MKGSSRQIIDITPVISEKIAVFPGDTPFSRNEILSFEKGHNLVLSNVTSTVHLGAHADAPSHYHSSGQTIEKQNLSTYIGPCQVIEVKAKPSERLTIAHIKHVNITSERILLKTNSFPDPDQWNDDFNSCSPELIDYLAQHSVLLVGIDTPSVDPSDDKELLSHNKIFEHKLSILEGIVLTHVKPGSYELIALPLPIKGCDASPVRAILIKENQS